MCSVHPMHVGELLCAMICGILSSLDSNVCVISCVNCFAAKMAHLLAAFCQDVSSFRQAVLCVLSTPCMLVSWP